MMFWCMLSFILQIPSIRSQQYPVSPISPIGVDQQAPYSYGFSNDEKVDEIENVEARTNEFVITTTKVGAPETLKISIGLVDIETGTPLPQYNMSGFLLVFTRGRYTLGNLRPNTWYGLSFFSEQPENGEIHRHSEHRLVKTTKDKEASAKDDELFTVEVQRNENETDSRTVNIKWLEDYGERKKLYAVVNLTLACEDSMKFKQFKMLEDQVGHSIPIKLETEIELVPSDPLSNRIFASIKPKHCHGICWNTLLGAEANGQQYEKSSIQKCEPIETINMTTSVRKYLGYYYVEDSITIHTNVSNNSSIDEAGSNVEVTIIDLMDMTGRRQNFSIETGQTDFKVEYLNPTNWYIAEYKYRRTSPFEFWDIERFIVEPNTTSENQGPVQLLFGYEIKNHTRNGNETVIQRIPRAKLMLNKNFKTISSVGVDTDAFCNSTDMHFWLTKDHPEMEINSTDLIFAICTKSMDFPICHHIKNQIQLQKCASTKFCYRGSVVLSNQVYKMKKHCADVANQFASIRRHTNSSETASKPGNDEDGANTAVKSREGMFSTLFSLFVLCILLNFGE